jgi:hypothetical protein
MSKVKRVYGKEFTVGDIIFNKKENTVYFIVNAGFFGIHKVILVKNNEGTYNMIKPYITKDGSAGIVNIGKTFPVTNKNGTVVEGITQGSLGLSTSWDKEKGKELTDNRNVLYFTTHRLKESKNINESIIQVGYVKGKFGIEADSEMVESIAETESKVESTIVVEVEEELPF